MNEVIVDMRYYGFFIEGKITTRESISYFCRKPCEGCMFYDIIFRSDNSNINLSVTKIAIIVYI